MDYFLHLSAFNVLCKMKDIQSDMGLKYPLIVHLMRNRKNACVYYFPYSDKVQLKSTNVALLKFIDHNVSYHNKKSAFE